MKFPARLLLITLFASVASAISYAQENRFAEKLDKYCKKAIQSFKAISPERKQKLDSIAARLVRKRYVVFTCKTNSRRTLLLQVWAQTSFYYYGLIDKNAFSIGDTVTPVYDGVAAVLSEVGFYVSKLANADPNGYMIAINKDLPENILSSKSMVGTIDTSVGLVVNICDEMEQAGSISRYSAFHLPYPSPTKYEETLREKQKYRQLNHAIAVEMLYVAKQMRVLLFQRYSERY